ncbi:MAG: hypothetical protein JST25_04585 [Actinobacteria bacterium]|nr:hypothetical protein [Actinomycetota bacterium]
MEQTSTQIAQWRLALIGLILGPALLVVSNAFIVPESSGGMRASFDAIATQPWLVLVPSVLEAAGFALTLAAFAAVSRSVARRGGALATTGAVLCVLGVLGFAWSAAGGLFLAALSGMKDRNAGFEAAMTMTADPVSGALISVLMFVGEAGILLVLLGLVRASLLRIWVIALVVAGIVADQVLPGFLSSLTADALLLAVGILTALSLRRRSRLDALTPAPVVPAPTAA